MSPIELRPFTLERVWTVEDIPVLTARITLPEPTHADTPAARRIRRYYHFQQRVFLRRYERILFPRAETEYRAALEVSAPLPCFRVEVDFTVTYREGDLLSLYTQARETGLPGQKSLQRWGDTWNTAAGYPMALPDLFPSHSDWKKEFLVRAEEEIHQQEEAGLARYHPHIRRTLRKHFNPRSYYLTPEGPTIFYPMGSIAPSAEGIPAFTIPFGPSPQP